MLGEGAEQQQQQHSVPCLVKVVMEVPSHVPKHLVGDLKVQILVLVKPEESRDRLVFETIQVQAP